MTFRLATTTVSSFVLRRARSSKMRASCPPVAFQQDPSGEQSGTSNRSGAFPPDDICNDDNVLQCLIPRDGGERSTQTSGSGGPLLLSGSRAALHSDRSRSPFQDHSFQFRPASWPKGGDFSNITLTKSERPLCRGPFQRPLPATSTTATRTPNTTQPLALPWQTQTEQRDNLQIYTWKVRAWSRSFLCFRHAPLSNLIWDASHISTTRQFPVGEI